MSKYTSCFKISLQKAKQKSYMTAVTSYSKKQHIDSDYHLITDIGTPQFTVHRRAIKGKGIIVFPFETIPRQRAQEIVTEPKRDYLLVNSKNSKLLDMFLLRLTLLQLFLSSFITDVLITVNNCNLKCCLCHCKIHLYK